MICGPDNFDAALRKKTPPCECPTGGWVPHYWIDVEWKKGSETASGDVNPDGCPYYKQDESGEWVRTEEM